MNRPTMFVVTRWQQHSFAHLDLKLWHSRLALAVWLCFAKLR